jgi:hypothetical protein
MISLLPALHTWGRILAAAGGVLGVLVAVPAFRLGGVWKTCLRIAAFVLIFGLSMLLEEQVLSSGGLSRVVKQPSLVGAVDESILISSRTEDFGDHLVLPAVELRPFEHPIFKCAAVERRLHDPRCRALPQISHSLRRGSFLAETLVWRPERGYYPARKKIC